MLDLAGRWGKERVPQRRPLDVGTHLREGRRGRTGRTPRRCCTSARPASTSPAARSGPCTRAGAATTRTTPSGWPAASRCSAAASCCCRARSCSHAGESYETPWLYASYGTGLDEVARRFHRFLRARPQHPGHRPAGDDQRLGGGLLQPPRPRQARSSSPGWRPRPASSATCSTTAGSGRGATTPPGWATGRSPPTSGPRACTRWSTRVTGLGMQFGLWFEPEMVNEDSDVARAHPEWIMATGGRLPVEARPPAGHQPRHPRVLRLHPRPDLRDPRRVPTSPTSSGTTTATSSTRAPSPTGRPGVHAQTLAFYRLVDEIKAAHPGLEIESCSSGGVRVDLGVLERTDRVWVSDCIDPLERQQMHRWTTQLIPPELMGSHIASGHSHTTGRHHDLRFRAATAIWGHLGVEWDITSATETELAELAGWIAFYKEHRALLLGGDLVRIDFPDDALLAGGVVAPRPAPGDLLVRLDVPLRASPCSAGFRCRDSTRTCATRVSPGHARATPGRGRAAARGGTCSVRRPRPRVARSPDQRADRGRLAHRRPSARSALSGARSRSHRAARPSPTTDPRAGARSYRAEARGLSGRAARAAQTRPGPRRPGAAGSGQAGRRASG